MARKLNVLMATHNYPRFRGDFAGVFIELLARRLVEHDIQPIIVAPHARGAEVYEQVNGVKIYRFRYADKESDENLAYHGNMHRLVLGSVGGVFRFKRFLDCFRQAVWQAIEKEQVDALVGHWLIPSGMVLKTVNQRMKLPTFMYSHGTDVRLARKYFKVAYRYLKDFCLRLNRWTVVSSYLKDEIVALDPRLESILEVLAVPHDETTFYRDDAIAKEDNLVVSVTRFTEQKRVDFLVKAFALVSEKCPQAKLEIYGSGPLQPTIEKMIERFGLTQKITINAPVTQNELRRVYNRAAMVVLNSYQEGFGLALSEAMLCGTAVIGTDSGGITDIIQNETRGLLVKPDNAAALAGAIERLLSDKNLRDTLAAEGHSHAGRAYASGALGERYAAIIRNALA
ncbi:MAG: glycosyltransferase family 4 protein [Candidatus Zixiibacteriota bacterium]